MQGAKFFQLVYFHKYKLHMHKILITEFSPVAAKCSNSNSDLYKPKWHRSQ